MSDPKIIAALMTTAFEGGSAGWLGDLDLIGRDPFHYEAPWYADEKFWDGDYEVQVTTLEDGVADFQLTPGTVSAGLKELEKCGVDLDQADADDADLFLQTAVFGELRYA